MKKKRLFNFKAFFLYSIENGIGKSFNMLTPSVENKMD